MAAQSLADRLRVLEFLLRAAGTHALGEGRHELGEGLYEAADRVSAWIAYLAEQDRRRESAAAHRGGGESQRGA